MDVFFSFALLCDYHECAAGVSLSLNIGDVYMGTVVRDEPRRLSEWASCRVPSLAPRRAPASRAASLPSHLAICMRTCAWLCSVAHITGRHTPSFYFLFRSATGYTLLYVTIDIPRLEVDIVVHHTMVSARRLDVRSTPWSVAGNVR